MVAERVGEEWNQRSRTLTDYVNRPLRKFCRPSRRAYAIAPGDGMGRFLYEGESPDSPDPLQGIPPMLHAALQVDILEDLDNGHRSTDPSRLPRSR